MSWATVQNTELLSDPVLGKYFRALDRLYKKDRWEVTDESRRGHLALFVYLIERDRGNEFYYGGWHQMLPNHYKVISNTRLRFINGEKMQRQSDFYKNTN